MTFDRYLDNDELAARLRELCAAHPDLARLSSLGTSHEGRDLPLLTLTNTATGEHRDKPALWVSGNIHAIEVAGSMACLHLAETLLSGHGSDPQATRLLDRCTFYLAPRLSPDGAARVFTSPRDLVLSSTRPYPATPPVPGLVEGDVDGDGRILDMRVPDPNGSYRVSDEDPRLMVRREPDEEGGTYYLLLPEGRIRDYDGATIRLADNGSGLNFNRNFPTDWGAETEQAGAGPYPLSEPETRAAAAFVADHPNIVAAMDYHTYSGIHLRPYGGRDDATMPLEDLWVWQTMGERATALTGYDAVSIWHGFRYHPTKGLRGGFLDWLYDQRGVYGWTTELWDMCREAGLERTDLVGWHHDHPASDDLALLRWNDRVLKGRAFVPWYPVDHPELGPVELGGWDRLFCWNNPPPELLQGELERNTPFVLYLASLLPRLDLRRFAAAPVADGVWTVELVVDNAGYLPSHGSQQAVATGACPPVSATLEGAEILDGPARRDLGHLAGRSSKAQFAGIAPVTATDHRARLTWLVAAEAGASIRVVVDGTRAGRARAELLLPPAAG